MDKAIKIKRSIVNSAMTVMKTIIIMAVSYTHLDVYKRQVEDYGNRYGVYVDVAGDENELIAICNDHVPHMGDQVYINVDFDRIHLFDGMTEKSLGYPEEVKKKFSELEIPVENLQKTEKTESGICLLYTSRCV